MNVLAYVKFFNGHINIETSFLFFYNNYAFVLMTKLLTQMEIYVSPGNEGGKVYLAFFAANGEFLSVKVKRYLQEKSIVP